MEDSTSIVTLDHIAIDNLLNNGSGLFGIFDGHGGAEVS
jgi:hypothetical protein